MRRFVPFALLVLSAVPLAGCGPSARERRNIAQAERITQEYAMAHGPRACGLLTNHAVKALYGNWNAPAPIARSICRRRSSEFRGERVTFTRSEVLDKNTIKINALDQDKKFSYQVNLRRGRGGRWRIDLVSQARVTPE
jgi:hypothetical protein